MPAELHRLSFMHGRRSRVSSLIHESMTKACDFNLFYPDVTANPLKATFCGVGVSLSLNYSLV